MRVEAGKEFGLVREPFEGTVVRIQGTSVGICLPDFRLTGFPFVTESARAAGERASIRFLEFCGTIPKGRCSAR
jgi:hypothetical protein